MILVNPKIYRIVDSIMEIKLFQGKIRILVNGHVPVLTS